MNSTTRSYEELNEICDTYEIKEITLGILLHIKSFCDKYNIRYYLGYGTLLGAVRHKGFIPWDDDIDILMPRPDYNKFIELHEKTQDRYTALNPHISGYYYNYCKVVDTETILYETGCKPIDNMGIFVDVFPLDGMPNDEKKVTKQLKKLIKMRKKISSFGHVFPHIRKNIIEYCHDVYQYLYCCYHDINTFQKNYLLEVDKYKYEKSKYVYATGGAYGRKSVFYKKWFDKAISIEFENHLFSAPIGYDEMLHQLYDKYMELPPENKRVSRHSYKAFYRLNGDS